MGGLNAKMISGISVYPPPRVQFAPAPVDEGEITIATSANDTATIAGAVGEGRFPSVNETERMTVPALVAAAQRGGTRAIPIGEQDRKDDGARVAAQGDNRL